jgi:hypothetical protein
MPAAIVRVSVALGACAALVNLLVWHQPIMEMANGHVWALRVLYAIWFVLGWGVATGALTGVAISSMRLRSPGRLSAAMAVVVSLLVTVAVCLVFHRFITDDKFMHDALGEQRPDEVTSLSTMPGMDMDMQPADTHAIGFNPVIALAPNFIAVALSVLYAFGGKRRGMRLSKLFRRSGSRKTVPCEGDACASSQVSGVAQR